MLVRKPFSRFWSNDWFLATGDVAWSEVLAQEPGAKLGELQAYIALRGRQLSAEDKKLVLIEAGAENGEVLTMKRVTAAGQILGAGVLQDYTRGKKQKLSFTSIVLSLQKRTEARKQTCITRRVMRMKMTSWSSWLPRATKTPHKLLSMKPLFLILHRTIENWLQHSQHIKMHNVACPKGSGTEGFGHGNQPKATGKVSHFPRAKVAEGRVYRRRFLRVDADCATRSVIGELGAQNVRVNLRAAMAHRQCHDVEWIVSFTYPGNQLHRWQQSGFRVHAVAVRGWHHLGWAQLAIVFWL